MACKLAIFEYVNEDNALDIGDTKQILNVDQNLLNNTKWDFDLECRVQSKSNGKTVISAAKILRFGDDRKALSEIVDGLIRGKPLSDIIRNQESLGRGRRQTQKSLISSDSDDENEILASKQQPAKRQKIKAKSDKELLATLKEKTKTQVKPTNNTEDDRTLSSLQKEVTTLKGVVSNLMATNTSLLSAVSRLEENNASLAATVASMSDLPSMVERLAQLITQQMQPRQQRQTPVQVEVPRRPVSPTRAPQLQPSQPPSDHQQSTEPSTQQMDIPPLVGDDTAINTNSSEPEQFNIPSVLVNKSNKNDARKMTNDLLTGMYSEAFMISHSVTGEGKPGMDIREVEAIITTVRNRFSERTDTEIRFFMREKLNNTVKIVRRRTEGRKKKTVSAPPQVSSPAPATCSVPVEAAATPDPEESNGEF